MFELDARKQTILRAIVVEYVGAAEPIASEALVQKYGLGVRSATVRNEMAEMADQGFLEQPHTSAGRIPSDKGYRYYVDRLVIRRALDDRSRRLMGQAIEEGDVLGEMLRDTVEAMSRVTQLLSVAMTIRGRDLTIKTAIVSGIGPTQALLVVVLSNGHVENRMLECPPGLTFEDLGALNALLSQSVIGQKAGTVSRAKPPTVEGAPAVRQFSTTIWTALKSITKDLTKGLVIIEGEEFLFAQPEFRNDADNLVAVIDELSSGANWTELSGASPNSIGAPSVTIGAENRRETLQKLSVIRQTFFVGPDEAGFIGLMGPTRMNYDAGLSLVDFTAQALSASLTRYLN